MSSEKTFELIKSIQDTIIEARVTITETIAALEICKNNCLLMSMDKKLFMSEVAKEVRDQQ